MHEPGRSSMTTKRDPGFDILVGAGEQSLRSMGVNPAPIVKNEPVTDSATGQAASSTTVPPQVSAPVNQTLITIAVIAGIFTAGYVILELAKRNDEIQPKEDDLDAIMESMFV